jgi:hypothetical protein
MPLSIARKLYKNFTKLFHFLLELVIIFAERVTCFYSASAAGFFAALKVLPCGLLFQNLLQASSGHEAQTKCG